jgi:GGDEF domain-containing protein
MAGYSGLDHVTGLTNLRQFLREIQRELARTRRNGENLAVVVMEPCRSIEITAVTRHLQGLVREEDVLARLGEEMIGVLLVSSSPQGGRLVAHRLQTAMSSVVPVSIGIRYVESGPVDRPRATDILRDAAEALNEARACGRGMMVSWHDMVSNTH